MTRERRDDDSGPEYAYGEEDRIALAHDLERLLPDHRDRELLTRALEWDEDFWTLLMIQRELSRWGDPQARLSVAENLRDDPSTLNRDRMMARQGERSLARLRGMGFDYDFKKYRVLLRSTGGTPPTLYGRIVRAMYKSLRAEVITRSDRREMLRRMSAALSPFFVGSLVSTGGTDKLTRSLDNCLHFHNNRLIPRLHRARTAARKRNSPPPPRPLP